VIILDGFLGVLYELAPSALDDLLLSQAMDGPAGQVKVHPAALGSNLMMIGAAELGFARFLADPAAFATAGLGSAGLGSAALGSAGLGSAAE